MATRPVSTLVGDRFRVDARLLSAGRLVAAIDVTDRSLVRIAPLPGEVAGVAAAWRAAADGVRVSAVIATIDGDTPGIVVAELGAEPLGGRPELALSLEAEARDLGATLARTGLAVGSLTAAALGVVDGRLVFLAPPRLGAGEPAVEAAALAATVAAAATRAFPATVPPATVRQPARARVRGRAVVAACCCCGLLALVAVGLEARRARPAIVTAPAPPAAVSAPARPPARLRHRVVIVSRSRPRRIGPAPVARPGPTRRPRASPSPPRRRARPPAPAPVFNRPPPAPSPARVEPVLLFG